MGYVSAMFLSVQQAARRLGVSPVTVRRWTATGFLPCTRTAGGHRRIDEHDIDDLARAIGNSNHLAAQLARERELDVLVDTSIALASRLDVTELLAEIARRMTALLDCHFCAISELDESAGIVYVLADYDHSGQRLPDTGPYKLSEYPLTRRVLEERITAVVNVDDPHVDQAEAAVLRRDGDKSLLMAPLVHQDRVIGLLEVVDQKRSRNYTRQEQRLCRAIAGQAAAALHNAKLFANQARSDHDITRLRAALRSLTGSVSGVVAADADSALAEIARAACAALEAVSCVASSAGASAGAFGDAAAFENGDERGTRATLVVARDPSGASDLTLVVTLAETPSEGQTELLDLIAAGGGALLAR
jgi:excisionase family DNA binding protein